MLREKDEAVRVDRKIESDTAIFIDDLQNFQICHMSTQLVSSQLGLTLSCLLEHLWFWLFSACL